MISTPQIIKDCTKFPCRISEFKAEILKKDFELDENQIQKQKDQKNLLYKYFYQYCNEQYMLLEEFLFRDNETFLDIKRAMGKNYYLYKQE